MHGGEIFVPKIPSVRIVDLATSIAPHLEQKVIGIRPGEKIHEIMCPSDSSQLTIEFDDHFVITPTIMFADKIHSYTKNNIGEEGHFVSNGFEYNSGTNSHFLRIDELESFK